MEYGMEQLATELGRGRQTLKEAGAVSFDRELNLMGKICSYTFIESMLVLEDRQVYGRSISDLQRLIILSFHEIQLARDPDCPLCGDSPSIRQLKDYQQICPIQVQSSIPALSLP